MSRFRTDSDRIRDLERQLIELREASGTSYRTGWYTFNVPYSAFNLAAASAYAKFASLPPGALMMAHVLILKEAFAAPGLASGSVQSDFVLAQWNNAPASVVLTDSMASPSLSATAVDERISLSDPSSGAGAWLLCNNFGANCDTLTAGLVTVYAQIALPEQPNLDLAVVNVVGQATATATIP